MIRLLSLRHLLSVAILISATSSAFAFNENPTPYDPIEVSQIDQTRSSSRYFVLDARLPVQFQHALDDRQFIGFTGLSFGAINNSAFKNDAMITVNDLSLMQRPNNVCSSYDSDICFDVSRFYKADRPQLGLVGLFALNGSTMLQWGFNTGYDSPKMTVSPSLLVGLAKRFYLSDNRDSHFIIEASQWIGASVKHRPCLDDFNRQYYCGSISAWSDFSYDRHPQSAFMKITYEKLF